MASLDGRSARGFLLGCVFCAPWGILGYYRPWSAQGEVGRLPPGEVSSTHSRTGNDARAVPDASGRAAPSAALRRPPHWPSPADPGYVGFDPPTIDLSNQTWGTAVAFELHFVNRSDGPVKIESARTSCGCTVIQSTDVEGRIVSPGETIDLSMTIDTEHVPGPKRHSVSLVLESGAKALAEVALVVEPTFEVNPTVVDFGEVDLEGDAPPPLRVVTFVARPERLLPPVLPDSEWIRTVTAERAGGVTEILIEPVPEKAPFGPSTARVTLNTTDRRVPPGVVFVRLNGMQRLVPSAGHVFLRGREEQIGRFSDREGKPVELKEAKADHEEIEARVVPPNGVAIRNRGGTVLGSSCVVRVTDVHGRRARVVAGTYPEE